MQIDCAVLPDGTRVLSERALSRAFGAKRGGSHWRRKKAGEAGANLPVFISAKNISSCINEDLEKSLSAPIVYRDSVSRTIAHGLEAGLLPKICEVLLNARDQDLLHPSQENIAAQADLLIRALAHVGIIALVDEATGYQEVRDKQALQAILDAYLRKELAAWAKRFPDEFYKQIFRLKGWQWSGMKVNRPSIVGKYTNDIVYERLAPGILKELRERNPRDETGQRKAKHHQWFTEDVGHPALAQHLHAVIGFMRADRKQTEIERLHTELKQDKKVLQTMRELINQKNGAKYAYATDNIDAALARKKKT